MAKFVSKPIQLDLRDFENEFQRADLQFHKIDHSGASFELRVFFNNPKADETTKRDEERGYAGSIFIFGHGGCYGDVGHCDVPTERRRYDRRPPHALTPADKHLIVTEALRKAAEKNKEITATVVPVVKGGKEGKDVLKIEKISLMTFD